MSKQYEFECPKCRIVVTSALAFTPDRKTGGPCPQDYRGEHSWMRMREYETK